MRNIFEKAEFIWCKGQEETVNCYVNFYDTLYVKNSVEYKFYITADSNYALYINDIFVDGGQFADYPDICKVYDEIVITPYLSLGENTLKIVGYCQNEDSSTYRKGIPGVMYTVTENGEPVLNSDLNTKVSLNNEYKSGPVAKVSGQLSYSFECDLTSENEVFCEAVETRRFEKLMPRPIKKLIAKSAPKTKLLSYGSFTEGEKTGDLGQRMLYTYLGYGYIGNKSSVENGAEIIREEGKDGIYAVYDLGREESGYLTFEVEVPEKTEILIGWGEHLEDNRVRTWIGGRNFAARVVVPEGRTSFTHTFKRSGGRYVSLHIYAPSAVIRYAGIIPTDYPTTADVSFRCADHLHNEIYEICKRTLLLCMHEHYEDCPWREQALYAMDSRNQMLCGYYTFKENDFAKASLRLIGQSIREDDLLELCSPARVSITIPCFCAIFVLQLWEYLLHSDDRAFAEEMLPAAERVCGKFRSLMDKNGLIPILKEYEYWNFYEWEEGLDGYIGKTCTEDEISYDVPLQAFVSLAFDSLSRIYNYLKIGDKAEKYLADSKALKKNTHNAFYDADKKYYYTKIQRITGERHHLSQLAQALAVYSGICPENEIDAVLENMINNEDFVQITLSNSIYFYEALLLRPEKYAGFVFDDIAKVFGAMLKKNATTFWETADGGDAFDYAGSLCHGWSAIPSYLYFKYCLGIYPDAPGEISKHDAVPAEYTRLYNAESDYFQI